MNDKKNHFIELKINRDFGDIISLYFDFFKTNIKKFTNIFLSYNGIFLIGLLFVSYLLVSGVFALIANNENLFGSNFAANEQNSISYFVIGGILFFLIFLIVAILNYSLSTAYMITYEEKESQYFNKSEVWAMVKNNIGNIIVFILIMILVFFGFMMLATILTLIPLVGMIAQYIIQYFFMAWVGVSFFAMLKEKRGVIEALGEGWNLVSNNFWRAVGVNFILGFLIGMLFLIILMIPGIIIGIYTFHVVQNNVALAGSIVPTLVYTLGTCVLLILMVYSQCLSQFINGILYYSLHEKTYNLHTRSKIDQIGSSDL
ncbi:hypothetical protein [Arenibacter certesii]|uniref:Glycerophosphoryl diester phosphodiesterase membrane domain-containing protein n=1 Tax=Arenibacter certesii TaxID=228955 RepID=A0A918MJW0_9FLAO|nr:hypothetical protein [Arenibacter certesii]GGW33277.1 hypothetical protein GCM10007383_17920 [Arenibacter certesii]